MPNATKPMKPSRRSIAAWNLADPGLLELKTDPMFTPLRADARFAGWVRKIGFF